MSLLAVSQTGNAKECLTIEIFDKSINSTGRCHNLGSGLLGVRAVDMVCISLIHYSVKNVSPIFLSPGGHASHLLHWFTLHSDCPVTGCSCRFAIFFEALNFVPFQVCSPWCRVRNWNLTGIKYLAMKSGFYLSNQSLGKDSVLLELGPVNKTWQWHLGMGWQTRDLVSFG